MHGTARQGNSVDIAEVNAALAHTPLGGHVQHLRSTDSTNDLALAAAQAGVRSGAWVADEQTAGRGRGGHTWHSAPGDGLYVSALLSPALPASALQLSLAAGLAAWEAVREVTGLLVDLRWPNDLVTREPPRPPGTHLEQPSRKLGGVLVEAAVGAGLPGQAASLRYAVIGIGINVAHRSFPPELAHLASSLFLEGWQTPDRHPLLIAVLEHLCLNVASLEAAYAGRPHNPDLFTRLDNASTWLHGKGVVVPEEGGYTGVTRGLDRDGFLRVDGDDGLEHTVRSGGVRERLA